jgi:hypothetical protein
LHYDTSDLDDLHLGRVFDGALIGAGQLRGWLADGFTDMCKFSDSFRQYPRISSIAIVNETQRFTLRFQFVCRWLSKSINAWFNRPMPCLPHQIRLKAVAGHQRFQ